jgi:hypothetical protein
MVMRLPMQATKRWGLSKAVPLRTKPRTSSISGV